MRLPKAAGYALTLVAAAFGLLSVPIGGRAQSQINLDRSDGLTIEGRINSELGFRYRVDFVARRNDRTCQVDDDVTGMWTPRVESFYFKPELSDTAHHIRIALIPPKGTVACAWEPATVHICVRLGENGASHEDCRPLLLMNSLAETVGGPINLICSPGGPVCTDESGRDPVRMVRDLQRVVLLNIDVKPPAQPVR